MVVRSLRASAFFDHGERKAELSLDELYEATWLGALLGAKVGITDLPWSML
jgi:hypothetical protein